MEGQLWTYFQAGGPIMWPLLLLSILSLATILERCFFWSRLSLKTEVAFCTGFLNNLEKSGAPGEISAPGPVADILRVALAHPEESGKAMREPALKLLASMERGMNLLDTIITASPMLGILGTVLGIISAFDMLGNAGTATPAAVTSGMAQALITTAAGLCIALATLFPFNYFQRKIENATMTIEALGSRLEYLLDEKK